MSRGERGIPPLRFFSTARPLFQRNFVFAPAVQIDDGMQHDGAQPAPQSAPPRIGPELRLPHAADNPGSQELDIDKIDNFIRIRSAANQVTGPTFNERSVLAVKLPPGLFVPARA